MAEKNPVACNGPAQWGAAFFSIILFWHGISLLLDSPVLPVPGEAIAAFFSGFTRLYPHLQVSAFRVLGSLVIALSLGVPAGILIGRLRKLDAFTSPLLYLTYPIPKIALLPVLLGILGLGESPRYILISMIIFYQILVTTRDAVREVNRHLISSTISLGAGEKDLFTHVYFPAALPQIFTALRISLGTALSVLFLTETFNTNYGIGHYILDASMRGNYKDVFAGIMGMSLLGFALFITIDFAEKKICPWQGK
jgi:NitT/TauT family transport system permease protein